MAARTSWRNAMGGALVGAVLLCAAPLGAQTIEGNSVTSGPNSNVNVGGTQNITIVQGFTLDDFTNALNKREAQIKVELQNAHSEQQQTLRGQLAELERQRTDLQASYAQTVRELEALQAKLSDLGEGIEDAKIAEAKAALATGDRSKADALFAEVEALEQEGIDRAAEAAYQRGVIAEQEIRWADAADHFSKAARLDPTFERLFKATDLTWKAGRYEVSYRFALERLSVAGGEFGDDSPEYAASLNNLALLLKYTGEFQEAESFYLKAIEIDRKTFGETHPNFAIRLNNFGLLMQAVGRFDDAERYFRQAIEIVTSGHRPQGPSRSVDVGVAGNTNVGVGAIVVTDDGKVIDMGDMSNVGLGVIPPRMRPARRRSPQDFALDLGGPDSKQYARYISNLANLLREMGRHSEAEPLLYRAIAINKRTIGERHPEHAADLNNLALVLSQSGRPEEGRHLLGRAVGIYRSVLGDAHPNTRRVVGNYANLLRAHFPDDPALKELEATFGDDIGK